MSYILAAYAQLPTKHGDFIIHGFTDPATNQEHVMLTYGIDPLVCNAENPITDSVLLRIHSECLTGDAFGSLKCECGPQLNAAFEKIAQAGQGVILYLRQEGRGIGLINKIRAYALQDQGHDTLDANLLLGLPADARSYEMCSSMLASVGINKVKLLTNNPNKFKALQDEAGIEVTERIALYVGINKHNTDYIHTKQTRMRHLT